MQRDLVRRPRQREPAAAALGAAEDAGADELLEDLGHEVARQVGAGDEVVQQDRPSEPRPASSLSPRIAYSVALEKIMRRLILPAGVRDVVSSTVDVVSGPVT